MTTDRSDSLLDAESEDRKGRAYVPWAALSLSLGHFSLLVLPGAAWYNGMLNGFDAAKAYYLNPGILVVWILGLGLDVSALVGLWRERRDRDRALVAIAIELALVALLPWVELVIARTSDVGSIVATLPLPWATTHFGPLGSGIALVGAVVALREHRRNLSALQA